MDDKPTSNVSPTEPTPAPATSSSSTAAVEGSDGNVAVAIAMVGRPTPSPDQLPLLPQPLSSSNSDSVSPHHADQNVEVSCQPCDASSHGGTENAADADLFISTPSPFKKQKSALALAGATDDKIEAKNSSVSSTTEDQELSDLPPLPVHASSATDPIEEVSPSKSDFISASPLQLQSPDANDTDFDFLGQEVMAAASTASAMLSRYDGFDPMPTYSGGRVLFDGDATTMATTETTPMETVNAMGVVFSHYPYQDDAFPLPPYLQVHLDETHAESTAVDSSEYGVSPMKGYANNSAPGTTPPSVSSRAHSHSDDTTTTTTEFNDTKVGGSRGKTLEQLAQAKKKQKSSAAEKTRPRPLPLRKRKFVMKDSDDEEYQPTSSSKTKSSNVVVKAKAPAADGKKRTMVRHNVRDDGDRITCKCSKSKCLKLYCDCFQQGKVCSPSDCDCKGCKNTQANSGPNGIRTKTIEEIMLRRPDAFEPRTRDADEGCRCKKNRCLKKYCICFNQGMACDSKCRCKNCENQTGQNNFEEEDVPVKVEVEDKPQSIVPPAKVQPKEYVAPTTVSFDEPEYGEPPKLPGGYTYGFGSPSQFTPDAGETAIV